MLVRIRSPEVFCSKKALKDHRVSREIDGPCQSVQEIVDNTKQTAL